MKEYLERSMTFTEYLDLVDGLLKDGKTTGPVQTVAKVEFTKLNRYRMNRLEKTTVLGEGIKAAAAGLNRKLTWLIITEGWCGDAAQNVPAIEKIAAESDNIETRYILRDENLELMDKENSFRSDLLYRLQGITIVIPPLRERLDEIPALARQAIARFCLASDQPEKNLSDDTLGMLLEYAWPGNVRELIHCIQRACLASGKSDLLLPVHLPTHMRVDCVRRRMGQAAGLPGSTGGFAATSAAPGIAASCGFSAQEMAGQDAAGQNPPSLREWKLQAEKAYVRQVWDLSGEEVRKAAEVAGISRGHWYELMKKIGL